MATYCVLFSTALEIDFFGLFPCHKWTSLSYSSKQNHAVQVRASLCLWRIVVGRTGQSSDRIFHKGFKLNSSTSVATW